MMQSPRFSPVMWTWKDGLSFRTRDMCGPKIERHSHLGFFRLGGSQSKSFVTGSISSSERNSFGPDDPLFPATLVRPNSDGLFDVAGLSRMGWATAGPIRRIFDERFTAAGLPYFHPHSFRDTLTQLGERICRTPEEMKARSQNFGHEKVATTLMSYGQVAGHRQAEIFNSLRNSQQQSGLVFGDPDAETINRVLEYLRRKAA